MSMNNDAGRNAVKDAKEAVGAAADKASEYISQAADFSAEKASQAYDAASDTARDVSRRVQEVPGTFIAVALTFGAIGYMLGLMAGNSSSSRNRYWR